jgi:hypothetical protein
VNTYTLTGSFGSITLPNIDTHADDFKGNFFTGIEIEKSPAEGMFTLFVVGKSNIDEIGAALVETGAKHIYFGANMSFNPASDDDYDKWDKVVTHFLRNDYWCTLDFDIKHVEGILECGMVEFHKFVPMISAKLPYIDQLGYNATLKLDDSGFNQSNPGVWCHRVRDLMDPKQMTRWDEYKDDSPV